MAPRPLQDFPGGLRPHSILTFVWGQLRWRWSCGCHHPALPTHLGPWDCAPSSTSGQWDFVPSSALGPWDCAPPVVAHSSQLAFLHGARRSCCFPTSTLHLQGVQSNVYGRERDEARSQVPEAVNGFVQEQFQPQNLTELGILAIEAVVEDKLKLIR